MISRAGVIWVALLTGCAHGSRVLPSARATASSTPGVCQPEPRYRPTAVADAGVTIYADPSRVSEVTVRAVAEYARLGKRDLQKFFGIPGPATYRIFIAGTTGDFDALTGQQTDWARYDWIVGVRLKDGTHVLRAPDTWSAKSRAYVKVDELIKHEMAHSFTFALNGKGVTSDCAAEGSNEGLGSWLWLEEGLASVAAGQHLTWRRRVKLDFEAHPHFAQISAYGNYATAASAVEYLIKTFSRDRVLKLIQSLPANYSASVSPAEVSDAIAAQFAPVSLAELERGWRAFARATYHSED